MACGLVVERIEEECWWKCEDMLFLINGISSTTFRFDLMRRFCARYDAVVEMIISRKFVLSLDDDIFVNTSIIKDEMDFVDWVYGQ